MNAHDDDSTASRAPGRPGARPDEASRTAVGSADGPDGPTNAPDGPADGPDGNAQTVAGQGRDAQASVHLPAPRSAPTPAPIPGVPAPVPEPEPAPAPGDPAAPPAGVAALAVPYQVGALLALAAVAVAVCVHLGMVFLHITPSNTVNRQHAEAVDGWIYPEFEQNWKLFAPNPLQQNIAVQVRAEVGTPDGGTRTTGWYDLSAEDGRAIDGNLLPSHTQQNELRRAWDFYGSAHDADNRAVGLRGALAEQYLRRIVVLRLERGDAAGAGGSLERVQVRSRTSNVPPPPWSDEKATGKPAYRTLPWWTVPAGEARGGVR
ncbi:DUF5819 family protein [Streptomyces sp. NPDC014889]|uniref:DUF5819 family protein n=1 Tax=Streptomyces sp. NPDC014889 TaxID=3364928 RepID=UPI0036FC53BF